MHIVIDIPEEAHKLLKNEGVDWLGAEHILNAVANGTPLSKGHGKLIDANAVDKSVKNPYQNREVMYWVNNAPTIIEADKNCRDCNKWEFCECGKKGHENGTSKGYSIGECTHFLEADKEQKVRDKE